MRQFFFIAILFFVLFSLGGAGIYLLGKALYTVYSDWRLGKELDELQAEMRDRRQRRQAEGEEGPSELA